MRNPLDELPDSAVYDVLQPLLEQVLARFAARGQGPREAAAYFVLRCGAPIRPHLLRFYRELSAPATADCPENETSREPQGERVDELAYHLAERAGFRGEPSHFWAEAERLIASRAVRAGACDRPPAGPPQVNTSETI